MPEAAEQEVDPGTTPDPREAGRSQAAIAEAALDAAISKLEGPGDDDDDAVHVAEAGEDEGAGELEEQAEEAGPEDEDDEAVAADEGDDGEEDDDDEEDDDVALHRAYVTLHESGVPMRVIKSTSRQTLIAWASRVEASEARASGSASSERGRDGDDDTAADPKEPAQAKGPTWESMRSAIAEKFGVDVDAVDSLKPLLDANEAVRAELTTLRSEMERERQSARERAGRETINSNVRRLEKKYPELKGDDGSRSGGPRNRLVEKAAALVRSGGYSSADEAFADAAKLVLGEPKRSDMKQLRRNGASPAPEGRGGSGRYSAPVGEEDYFTRAMDTAYRNPGRRDLISRLQPPASLTKPARKRAAR